MLSGSVLAIRVPQPSARRPACGDNRLVRAIRVTQTVPGTVYDVEQRWYDTSRWAFWVDELETVVDVAGDWPEVGAAVTWESGPAGRGHVVERVIEHEPLAGQTVDVADDSITGRQSVAFAPDGDGVEVALSLAYEIRKRSLFTPLVDILFIRRAMATSLSTTLSRFAAEATGHRSPSPPGS
jgi:hypothetical protein